MGLFTPSYTFFGYLVVLVLLVVVIDIVRSWWMDKRYHQQNKQAILRALLEREVDPEPYSEVTLWERVSRYVQFNDLTSALEHMRQEGLTEQVPVDEKLGLQPPRFQTPCWRLTEAGRRAAETTPHL